MCYSSLLYIQHDYLTSLPVLNEKLGLETWNIFTSNLSYSGQLQALFGWQDLDDLESVSALFFDLPWAVASATRIIEIMKNRLQFWQIKEPGSKTMKKDWKADI